jgi:hypothetical protein
MPRLREYLFVFGYRTPEQLARSLECGSDDEDSRAVYILAPSESAALEWGRTLAEKFVQWLYGDQKVSWTAGNYAHWVEANPTQRFSSDALVHIPRVEVGQLPNWEVLYGRKDS